MRLFRKLIKLILKLASPYRHARFCGVKMGKGCFIATRYMPTEAYLIDIGDNVAITGGVKIFTHGGARIARSVGYPNFDVFGKVTIGDWSYIGSNALIMPGVSIGKHVLVAAGSVVTHSVPDNVCVAGNPAKIICTTDEFVRKNLKHNYDTKPLSFDEKKSMILSHPEKLIRKSFLKV